VLIPVFLFIQGCNGWKEDEGFHYYESEYIDSIITVINQDDISIQLSHTRNNYMDSGIVQIELAEDSTLQDTIKIYLDILFGNSIPTPTPYKGDSLINDTLYIWYLIYQESVYPKYGQSYLITGINIPKPPYYRVKKIEIYKSPMKNIAFSSRFRN